ncbi:MAG: hypothetical protein IPJ88_10100 [Myxococcales bacterium]|nr:MAG: hypothetical protein IPJ88_10100 [Myxococcales bacterium]
MMMHRLVFGILALLSVALIDCGSSKTKNHLSDASVQDALPDSATDASVDGGDSDGDGISDIDEGQQSNRDTDGDGTPDYLDLDSDGDCRSDEDEAQTASPVDSDNDGKADYLDLDSDNDGLSDGDEDKDCDGVKDAGETSARLADTDSDGASDLIEVTVSTDPNDASDNPNANGDLVFVMQPSTAPQPEDETLAFEPKLQAVDMYVLLDRSGSMATEIASIRDNLATVVNNLSCPPVGIGDPADCIPDLWAGAGSIGYSGSGGLPYENHVDLQVSPSFSSIPTTEPGGCCSETLTFGVWAAVTGSGSAQSVCTLDSVAARASCAASPASTSGFIGYGYPCFREGALPVVLLATDEAPLSSADTYECPAWPVVSNELNNRGAKLVGIVGSGASADVTSDLQTMATATGAVDSTQNNAPLVFDGASSNAANAIESGLRALISATPLSLNIEFLDDQSDAVDTEFSFVDHIETLQLGSAECSDNLTDVDSNADGFQDQYVNIVPETPLCWKLVVKNNTTVPATNTAQLFTAKLSVIADSITEVSTRSLYFIVPPN